MAGNGNNETPELTSRRPRRIAILTAGGDAPGMNAAIRAVVRSAAVAGIEVIGFRRGYEGLIRDLAEPLSGRSVANMIQRGGTFLETSRSPEFRTPAAAELPLTGLNQQFIAGLEILELDLAATRIEVMPFGRLDLVAILRHDAVDIRGR